MEKKPFLINVGRGELVNDQDLLKSIDAELLSGAVLDVFPEEPVPSKASFRKESNILFTSHVAGALQFSYQNIRDMMMDDIRQILKGLPPTRLQRAKPHQAVLRRDR